MALVGGRERVVGTRCDLATPDSHDVATSHHPMPPNCSHLNSGRIRMICKWAGRMRERGRPLAGHWKTHTLSRSSRNRRHHHLADVRCHSTLLSGIDPSGMPREGTGNGRNQKEKKKKKNVPAPWDRWYFYAFPRHVFNSGISFFSPLLLLLLLLLLFFCFLLLLLLLLSYSFLDVVSNIRRWRYLPALSTNRMRAASPLILHPQKITKNRSIYPVIFLGLSFAFFFKIIFNLILYWNSCFASFPPFRLRRKYDRMEASLP